MRHPVDLAGVISSRICHDLVSPVGAIVNGIDLMREIGAAGLDQEIAMIGQSAGRASGLLQFYRLAFGDAQPGAQGIARTAMRGHAQSMINWQRTVMDWQAPDGPPMNRAEAKLLCQLLLCARSLAGMSGTIRVELGHETALPMRITVIGDGAPDADERLALFTADPRVQEPSARLVEFPLAVATATDIGLEIESWRLPGEIGLLVQAD